MRCFTWLALILLLSSIMSCRFSEKPDTDVLVVRGSVLHFLENPATSQSVKDSYQYIKDGIVAVKDGKILKVGKYSDEYAKKYSDIRDHRGSLIIPGFVDTHIHYPQTEMIASYGEQLLEWLQKYTFPTEKKFADYEYASNVSGFFLDELLKNGTTSALVFSTVHKESVDALFTQAKKRNMRIISGKVLMNRNAPDYLQDTVESGYRDSKELIQKWHGNGRLLYAITPRFAPTSTPEQLEVSGKLKKEFPDVYVHTHLSENKSEIAWVKSLFPERKNYFDVYNHYGLAGNKSVFAHSIHLTEDEWKAISSTGSSVSFCPTSNLFLGSGLFNLSRALKENIRVGLGTDVGAGTSFSQFRTLNEAYKVNQLQEQKLSSLQGFYLATLGGAESLSIDHLIGNFVPGKEADFVVLDWAVTDLQSFRQESSDEIEEKLFALMMLGDERNVRATYVAGEKLYENDNESDSFYW